MNKDIYSNRKPTILFPLISNMNPQVLCLWEIKTNSKVLATPSVVQLVTEPINPLRGATSLEIIPLHVQTFTIFVSMTTDVSLPVEGSERSDKKKNEPINPSFTILDNILEYLGFIFVNVPLTPH